MASPAGRGAQVILDDVAQAAARGAVGRDLAANTTAKRALEEAGLVGDGFQPDGASRTGLPPEDVVQGIAGKVDGSAIGYTPSGTGAVVRTVQDRIRDDAVSIADFLTLGAADDQAAFVAALATGRPVKVPYRASPYLLTTFINLTSGAFIFGEGRPTIKMTGNGRAFRINAVSNVTIKGLVFDGNKGGGLTANSGIIFLQGATSCLFQDCDFVNGSGTNFVSSGSTGNRFVRCRFTGCAATALDITGATTAANMVDDCEFQLNGGFGVRISTGAHHNAVRSCRTDQNGLELVGITYDCHNNRVIGNHAEGTGDNGFSISGYANVVVGNRAYKCAHSGIYLYGRENVCTGNSCVSNGQRHNPSFWEYEATETSNYSGIAIAGFFGGTAQNNTVSGNFIDDDQATGTQFYGVSLGAAAYDAWVTATATSSGAFVRSNNKLYVAAGAGTTGATAPSHTTGTVSDGGVNWTYVCDFAGGTGEAYGNTVVGNRVYRVASGGADYNDATVNASNTVMTSSSLRTFGTGSNTVGGGFQVRGSVWTSGQAIVYGDIRYTSNRRVYRCSNVGGTASVVPVHTTGSATGADGIRWQLLANSSQQVTSIDFNTSNVSLGTALRMPVTDTTNSTVHEYAGNGSPEGVVTAPVGSTYRRADGGAGTCFYVKESGVGATGWTPK
jgi:parallel beta-helix repeat protein